MKSEIGSEFWTGCTKTRMDVEYTMRPPLYGDFSVMETLSGRTALEYVVEQLVREGKRSVYMPSYCCHTMIEPFYTHGIEVGFYDVVLGPTGIERSFDSNNHCDIVFLMDYFGHIDDETEQIAEDQKQKGKALIYDATHSMYSQFNTVQYDYIIGSYRKWVDINCGFLAEIGEFKGDKIIQNKVLDDRYSTLRKKTFDLKADYMAGRINDKTEFLNDINRAEDLLEEDYHHQLPDDRSVEVLKYTDADFLKQKRALNGRFLTKAVLELNHPDVRCMNTSVPENIIPLFIPVYVSSERRNDLRRFLINKDIYCPIHWPLSELHSISDAAKDIYDSELSIICDQRYGIDDMQRIVGAIKEYLNN